MFIVDNCIMLKRWFKKFIWTLGGFYHCGNGQLSSQHEVSHIISFSDFTEPVFCFCFLWMWCGGKNIIKILQHIICQYLRKLSSLELHLEAVCDGCASSQ